MSTSEKPQKVSIGFHGGQTLPIRVQPAELARAGDENAPQPDARTPPPFEDLAHKLTQREGEGDVQHEKDAPHEL